VASRKEQKEALRLEREERQRQAQDQQRRKRLVGIGIGAALLAAAVVVVAVLLLSGGGDGPSAKVLPSGGEVPSAKVTDLKRAAATAGCRLSSERAKSRNHAQDPNAKLRYRTNPPTDGRHYEVPTEDGAYSKAPPDSHLVHSLEHGRIIIWFKPTLPEQARASLKAFFDEDSYQIILVPRKNMPFQVAASAWGRDPEPLGTGFLMGCGRYSDKVFDALRTFRDEHRSNGPEPIP
jgi:Protein of unknown function (DUF3105)